MKRWWLALASALALLLAGAVGWAWRELQAPSPLPPGGALVTVAPGEPFGAIAAHLQAAGVVRHGWLLRWWARWKGLDRLVHSGDYRFDKPLPPLAVLEVLQSAVAALHRITVPEGSTVAQVAALVAAAGFGGADQFLCLAHDARFLLELDVPASGLEGYLFPDTYAFSWRVAPRQIIAAMVRRFRERTAGEQTARLDSGMSEEAMVILGSLVEKETGAPGERALVSAVFHNRLRRGMPLQSDPTTVYGREGRVVPTRADLLADSPYNTYRHTGLPPGPICNPGVAALTAAVAPAAVDYLYFVSRHDGTHVFSRTLEEHNHAVARYERPLRPHGQ